MVWQKKKAMKILITIMKSNNFINEVLTLLGTLLQNVTLYNVGVVL